MPKVTVYQGGAIQPQGVTTARHRAADYGASGLARGLASVGEALKERARIDAEIDNKRSEARVKRADVAAEIALSQARTDQLSTSRFDAMGASERFREAASTVRERSLAGLTSKREKDAFGLVFDEKLARDLGTIGLHERREVVSAEKDASSARVKTYVNRAVELRDDPEGSAESLSTALVESDKLWTGYGADVLAGKRAEITSEYHVRIAEALAVDDPVKAQAWVNRFAPQILEIDETAIRAKLQPGVEEAELDAGMQRIDEILAGAPSAGPEVDAAPATQSRATVAKSNGDPLRGKGRVTTSPEEHVKRGRLAIDLAAPAGTPIYPPMSGTVVDKGYDPNGNGHFVRVRHPNGYTSTFLHMRSASPFKVGDEVSSGSVLGGVGSTGHSTGNHLDYSVKNAAGNPVNPVGVRWEEKDPPPLPAYAAQRNDKAALYAAARRVAVERNYSRRQYEGLLQRVDQVVAREDGLQARAEADETRTALETIAGIEVSGGKLTRRDQIPNWSRLPADVQLQLNGQIEANTKPKSVAANGDAALTFELMSIREPQAFAATDLRLYRHQMTPEEFSSLAAKQAEIRTKGPTAPVVTDHGRIWSVIREYDQDVGLDATSQDPDERARSLRVFNIMRNNLNTLTGGKRAPTDDEVKRAFDRATITVYQPTSNILGMAGKKEVRRFDMEDGGRYTLAIPNDVKGRIVASYRRQYGRNPTEAETSSIYLRHKGEPGFW